MKGKLEDEAVEVQIKGRIHVHPNRKEMVKWDRFGQMGSNDTLIYFSDHFGTKYTGWTQYWYVFGRCNLQTIGILDYLQEYPSQFSTIKKHNR